MLAKNCLALFLASTLFTVATLNEVKPLPSFHKVAISWEDKARLYIAEKNINLLGLEHDIKRASDFSGVPPELLMGLITVESSWNPKAKSWAGAHGLTQIIPRYHRQTLRTAKVVCTTPECVSVWAGAQILAQYSKGVGFKEGLKRYNGASDYRYSNKVLNAYREVKLALN